MAVVMHAAGGEPMRQSLTSLGATMFALGSLFASPAFAVGGVVGTGTAASCTETAFNTVLGNAQSSGGGVITFNCGTAPVAIVFTNYKTISSKIEVRGAGLVTLSGGNSSAIFQVFNTG